MIFYGTITAVLMLLAFLTRENSLQSHASFKFSIILVFLLVAFRYEVGCDWSVYQYHYDIQTGGIFNQRIPIVEPAYWVLLDVVHGLGLPFATMNVVTSFLFFAGLYYFARTQPNPMTILAIAFPLLIFALPMSAIRQAAAMGFIMPAMVFFARRQTLLFCAFILAAFLFHTSSILFLLMAPYTKFRVSVKNVLLALPLVYLVGLRMVNLEGVEAATDRYVDNARNAAAGAPFRTFTYALSGLAFFAFARKRWAAFNKSDYNMAFIGAGLLLLTFPLTFIVATVADRYGYAFIIFQAMIFARLHYLKIPNANILLGGFMFGMFVFFVTWFGVSWQLPYCYSPYQSNIIRLLQ